MEKERLPWFPCYPSKLLGAFAGMRPDEGYVYWIVCLRIYEVGGPCPDTVDALARRSGMNRRRVSDALALSFAAGRLVEVEGGIMNPFAEEVLSDMEAAYSAKLIRIRSIDERRPPPEEWVFIRHRVFERDDYTCRYCGKRGGELECDHVIPICQNGTNNDSNLVTSCRSCNREKGGRTVNQWRSES